MPFLEDMLVPWRVYKVHLDRHTAVTDQRMRFKCSNKSLFLHAYDIPCLSKITLTFVTAERNCVRTVSKLGCKKHAYQRISISISYPHNIKIYIYALTKRTSLQASILVTS